VREVEVKTTDRHDLTATLEDFSPPLVNFVPRPGSLVIFEVEGNRATSVALIDDSKASLASAGRLPRSYGVIAKNDKTQHSSILLTDDIDQPRYVSFLNKNFPAFAPAIGHTISFLGLTSHPDEEKKKFSNLVALDRGMCPFRRHTAPFLIRK